MDHFTSVPRLSLGLYPTPLYLLKNISAKYGRNIYIKRDDLCGIALGGKGPYTSRADATRAAGN